MIERSGDGRREGDGHCSAHEKNTTDLSRLKGYVAVIALIAMPVIGYYVGNIDKKMERFDTKIDGIINTQHEGKIMITENNAKLENLEASVKQLMERRR